MNRELLAKQLVKLAKAIAADDEPEEEDITITDRPRGGYDVGEVGGKHLGHFDDRDEAEKFVKKYMHQHNFFPNVWFIDDHGGADIIKVASKKQAADYGVIETLDMIEASKTSDAEPLRKLARQTLASVKVKKITDSMIETAPELLDALLVLIPHVLHYSSMQHAHMDAARDAANARAAIAKAEK